jgi:tetratricopeptide (TPR) repeat protein
MKKYLILLAAAAVIGCDTAGKPVAVETPTNGAPAANDRPQTAIAHSTDDKEKYPTGTSGDKSGWTQGGDPIDTAAMDAAIKDAEKALAAKPNDASAKKALAAAYLKRATALTDARQYASALGDYRRVLKNDPENGEAKQWISQITGIYDSMNKKYPAEGEEPPPLPFKKES